MNILVLFTGGTIGSVRVKTGCINGVDQYQIMTRSEARERGYDISKTQDVLIEKYKNDFGDNGIAFDSKEIADVCSENMTLAKWNEITESLRKIDFSNYYGVIITHGTDTLGYFANYLSMIFSGIDIPMVLVSSNYELNDQRANGTINFKAACDFIKNVSLSGVYVTYRNTLVHERKTKVIYGSRVLQCSSPSNDFESINVKGNLPLGLMDDSGFFEITDKELYSRIEAHDRYNPRKNLINNYKSICSKILVVRPYVGIDYSAYNLKGVNAVLHHLYHSGTACIDKNATNTNIINFAKMVKKSNLGNTDIFAGPIYGKEDRDLYTSSQEMIEAGIDFIVNTSSENAYVKLLLAYTIAMSQGVNTNQMNEFVLNFMQNELNNEFIQPTKKLIRRI